MEVNNVDLKDFIQVLDACEGEVYMVTSEGDRLNLKSSLCRLIGFSTLIQGGTVSNAHLECQNKEDERKLFRFNLFGETAP